jgi:F-type H+-transporting ATPase subunit gamma
MSDTLESLQRKIDGATELKSMVGAMKALAAASIGQYETAVVALNAYFRTIELGLRVCLKDEAIRPVPPPAKKGKPIKINAVVFGSDQGLVGRFNDVLTDYALKTFNGLKGDKKIWAVGERIQSRIEDAGIKPEGVFNVPLSVGTITGLVEQIIIKTELQYKAGETTELYIYNNCPEAGAIYKQVGQRLLPLDEQWLKQVAGIKWPSNNIPEAINGKDQVIHGLISEYLFVSIYRACAQSLAAENAARLASMQRAEKNIDDMKDDLLKQYHHVRQSSIDEELFDVISGAEELNRKK